jgi:hypothetical protein
MQMKSINSIIQQLSSTLIKIQYNQENEVHAIRLAVIQNKV